MTFFKTSRGGILLAVGAFVVGLMLGARRSSEATSIENLTRAGCDLIVKFVSMNAATESLRNVLAVVALILGSAIALRTYFWNRRQKRVENTIAVVEREMYEQEFQAATDLLESALHNPRFADTTPFQLPRDYRNAFLLIVSHYTTVLARARGSLLDEQLYRQLLGFRLKRNLKILEPYIKALRYIEEDNELGADILKLLDVEVDASLLTKTSGWVLNQQYMIRNMSPRTIVSYLENQTAQRFVHKEAFAVSPWFELTWKVATRETRIRWVDRRKEQLREEILSFQLAGLSWPDLTRAMERLDGTLEPTLAEVLADPKLDQDIPEVPTDFMLD